ncbi:hypothetical protein ACTWQA_14845 [Nonomuraea sp. 10N515B]
MDIDWPAEFGTWLDRLEKKPALATGDRGCSWCSQPALWISFGI